jgi:hypothetical protein
MRPRSQRGEKKEKKTKLCSETKFFKPKERRRRRKKTK